MLIRTIVFALLQGVPEDALVARRQAFWEAMGRAFSRVGARADAQQCGHLAPQVAGKVGIMMMQTAVSVGRPLVLT